MNLWKIEHTRIRLSRGERALGQRRLVLVGLGLILAIVACQMPGVGVPVREALLPRGANPILVSITRPESGGAYPAGGAISLSAEAFGAEPIVSLELWADGLLAGVADHRGESRTFARGSWEWTIPSLGDHLLFVRAVDALGRTADSTVVLLKGLPDAGLQLHYQAAGDETLESLAEFYGVDPASLIEENGGSASQPLAAGDQVVIPIAGSGIPAAAPPVLPPIPGSTDPAEPAPASLGSAVSAPAAPGLTASAIGCSARLYIGDTSSDEAGFYIYRLAAGASSFSRIATIGPHSGDGAVAFDTPETGAAVQFYAASFNAAGEAASNVVPFATAPSCIPGGNSLRLQGDALILGQPLQLAYVYYSLDGGPWARLPADPHVFFEPGSESVALGSLLGGHESDLDVWGWNAGTLIHLGNLHSAGPANLPPSQPASTGAHEFVGCPVGSCTGDIGGTLWSDHLTVAKFGPRSFRWMAPSSGVSGGLWQVASTPFGGKCSLAPAGLVLSDLVSTSGGKTTFPIDLSPLAPKPLSASNQPQVKLGGPGPILPGLPTLGNDSLLEMKAGPSFVLPGSNISPDANALQDFPLLIVQPEALLPNYYVRILPIVDGQPQCQPSTTVVVTYDPTPQPQVTFAAPDYTRYVAEYDVQIVDFSPPVFPDPNLWGCVKVVGVKLIQGNLANNAWAAYIGQTVCPKSFQGGSNQGLEGFLDDIASAWDYVVDLYEKLEGLVKEFAAKFNPLCLQAEFVAEAAGSGEAKTTIQDACEIGASIAVAAAKAYVGIPPSLPKWDQLDDLGKDYLVELAADEFSEATGIPCDDECKDLMRSGVDTAYESLSNEGSASSCVSQQEAHEHGVEPLCPPSGVKYKAAPGAAYTPPVAWLEVTRLQNKSNAPDPQPFPGCTTGVSMTVEYQFPGGNVSGPYSPTGTPTKYFPPQSVTVLPFQGSSAKIPRLKVGEQVSLAIPFKGALPVLFPWTKEMFLPYQEVPNAHGTDFYRALVDGTITLTAHTSWPEYETLKQSGQYPGATNLSCGAPAQRAFPPGS